MKITNPGIDYSLGTANFDKETGVHFGVINQNEVSQAWFDSSEAQYSEILYCPACSNEVVLIKEGSSRQLPNNQGVEIEDDIYHCNNCDKDIYESEMELDFIEPLAFTYNQDGYLCEQSADDTDIFITKSPYFTYCQYCSPCAPGAGYLMNYMDRENGIKAYCLGHDWFEDNKAPYPVYSVETGELIEAE